MVFVVTADQRASRRGPDLVEDALVRLNARTLLRPFERTAGDEVQGVIEDAVTALEVALGLLRDGHWSVGVGAGGVREPLPASTRAGAGPAFERAREAVEAAKKRVDHIAFVGGGRDAEDADALLSVHAAIVSSRSEAGWEAVDLVIEEGSQVAVAERLGVSRQAVSQRLRAAWWPQQRDTTPLLTRLMAASEGES